MDSDPLAELGIEERRALAELAKARASGTMDRRDYLQAGGLLLGGGLLGGSAAYAGVDQASADASTTDSDGDVGLPGDRVDVFADGVDATSVSTDELNNVTYVSGSDIKTAIENASDGAHIVIENGTHQVNNPINFPAADLRVSGQSKDGTFVEKSNDDVLFALEQDYNFHIDHLTLRSTISDTTHGVQTGGSNRVSRLYMEHVAVRDMGQDGIRLKSCNVSNLTDVIAVGNGRHGLNVGTDSGLADANAATFTNLDLMDNGQHGYYDHNCYGNVIHGGYATYNGGDGWNIGSNSVQIFNAGGESNSDATIRLTGNANYPFVVSRSEPSNIVNDGAQTPIIFGRDSSIAYFGSGRVEAAEYVIYNDAVSGSWSLRQDGANRNLIAELQGTSSSGVNLELQSNGGDNDFEANGAGAGVVVEDADGSGDTYRIRVNGGTVEAQGPL